MNTVNIIFDIIMAIIAVVAIIVINKAYQDFLTPKTKEGRTPYMIFWLNHPEHKGERWMMQFDKELMCYGNTFKITYDYYKRHKEEFEVPKINHDVIWKELNIDV